MMCAETPIQVVPRDLLEALAAEASAAPESKAASAFTGIATNGQFTSRLLVDRWLQDRGIEFRIKAEPDGRGRTVYVLKSCPFDQSHGDPDSCIMQAPNGKLSAQCFHNSCQGRGWQEFKKAIGVPEARHYDPPLVPGRKRKPVRSQEGPSAGFDSPVGEPPDGGNDGATGSAGLPLIQGNKRQLRHITADALAAVIARNNPPTVFVRGGVLTRLKPRDENEAPLLDPLTDPALRGVMARAADWIRVKDTQNGQVAEEAPPPLEAVKDLSTLPSWEGVPPLRALVEAPVFDRDGGLVLTPGYHRRSRLWYDPDPGLTVPSVADRPTPAEVARAKELLLGELLGDFPFADEASRAHALAAQLLPFVRPMIDGPTPLHLLDAPVEGTGKTLLASAIAVVATGRDVEAIAEASCDEEWRKRITAVLAEGPTIVLLDNLNRVLDSGALASVLTSRVWKDRILGVSKTARLPVTAMWLASGNNTRLSRELIRRTVWCRLDAKVDAPWLRTGYRHPHLLRWARASRGELVWAALTLVQGWMMAGRPPGGQSLGMFESWAEIIGGILDVAGVPGLLGNAQQFRAARADQVGEWRAFVAAWWQRHGVAEVGVEDLFNLASQERLLDSVLGDKGERSQRTKLGLALSRSVDRVFGEFRLESAGEDHRGRQQFRLVQVAEQPEQGEQQWEA